MKHDSTQKNEQARNFPFIFTCVPTPERISPSVTPPDKIDTLSGASGLATPPQDKQIRRIPTDIFRECIRPNSHRILSFAGAGGTSANRRFISVSCDRHFYVGDKFVLRARIPAGSNGIRI
jgi:hypothetical protein